jgi:hypothetical protein
VRELQAAERVKLQPQIDVARGIHREGLKQHAIARGVSAKEADEMVTWAEKRILLPSFLLWFQAWGYVSVADVLADPEKFNGKRLADPEEGPGYVSQTPAIVRVDGGDIRIDSFAHGAGPTDRQFYLRSRDQLIELAQGDRWFNPAPEDMEAMMLTAGQTVAAPIEAVIDLGAVAEHVTVEQPQPKFDFAKQMQEALKRPQSGKGRVNIRTLAELQHQKFPDLKELVPGLIVEGCLLLAARPKIGKSWLTLDIGLAVAMGDKCFNDQKQCVQGDVLYLALEDGDRRIQRRGSKLLPTFTGTWPSNFYYATEWPRGNDGLAEIEKWVSEHQAARLVVIDILAKFRVPTSSKRAAYDQDYEALSGLQHLAQKYQITIIVVHHTRKAEGADPFEEISGTLGITGAVDAAMVIKPTAQGKLLVTRGRDLVREWELAVRFVNETCKWEILGDPEAVHMSEGRTKILEALKQMGEPMSPKELRLATGLDEKAAEHLLHRMAVTGLIEKIGRGKYRLSNSSNAPSEPF